jgi:hypothetical protein
MAEITLTNLRKDLFRLVDEMIETGRPLRVRRGSVVVELNTRVVAGGEGRLTPQQRWERFLEKPERPTDLPVEFEDLEYGHWDWNGEVGPR